MSPGGQEACTLGRSGPPAFPPQGRAAGLRASGRPGPASGLRPARGGLTEELGHDFGAPAQGDALLPGELQRHGQAHRRGARTLADGAGSSSPPRVSKVTTQRAVASAQAQPALPPSWEPANHAVAVGRRGLLSRIVRRRWGPVGHLWPRSAGWDRGERADPGVIGRRLATRSTISEFQGYFQSATSCPPAASLVVLGTPSRPWKRLPNSSGVRRAAACRPRSHSLRGLRTAGVRLSLRRGPG